MTELANLMGGTYLTGASQHWRKEERESGRDLFLNQAIASQSREYRCAVQESCSSYVREVRMTNENLTGSQLVTTVVLTKLSSFSVLPFFSFLSYYY